MIDSVVEVSVINALEQSIEGDELVGGLAVTPGTVS
jgi:hypothetical protein